MADDKIVREYAMKNDKKSEIFHSSGIAAAGSGENIGAGAEALEFAKRQALDGQRQMVGKYRDAQLGQSMNTAMRAKAFTGDTRRGFGRKEGSGPEHQGYGRSESPATRGYGRTEGNGTRGGYGRTSGGSVGAGGSGGLSTPPARKNSGVSLH